MTWALPPLSVLDVVEPRKPASAMVAADRRRITSVLAEHGISATVELLAVGPQAARYGLTLGPGVLPGKVARSIDAVTLATGHTASYSGIMGSQVLVDVARPERETVQLRSLIESSEALVRLGFPVGMGFDGPVTARLADLPHLLVAGSTGGGKSGFLNSLLVSLLMRNSPAEMRLLLVDPKQVELAPYAALPHLSDRGVVTDTSEAAAHLASHVESMEKRYDAMREQGVRDWADYRGNSGKPVPRQVVVIDELADLLMTNPEVEQYLVRLGQKGRAAGMHIVAATQRPDAKTITPLIKANIPGRAVFRVADGVNSKVALDRTGAERLTGKGDGLFLDPHAGPDPVRFQAAWTTPDEVTRVVAHWVAAAEPERLAREQDARLAERAERARRDAAVRETALARARQSAATEQAREQLARNAATPEAGDPVSDAMREQYAAFEADEVEFWAEKVAGRAFELLAERLEALGDA